jgi:hypothetical protein
MPDAGMVQVFWQSESTLHLGAQPELIPDVEALLLVVVLPPLPVVLRFPPPDVAPLPVPVPVLVCPPTPPTLMLVSLPEAQAAKMAALVEKRATKVSLTYFTLLGRDYTTVANSTRSLSRLMIPDLSVRGAGPCGPWNRRNRIG